jgi:4a-hydroxytetrahydrobiopterin dehydratase
MSDLQGDNHLTDDATPLHERQAKPVTPGSPALAPADAGLLQRQLAAGWATTDDAKELAKTYTFDGYAAVLKFINAAAAVAEQIDHHPVIQFAENTARVRFTTNSVGGLTENDFIAAAKVEQVNA